MPSINKISGVAFETISKIKGYSKSILSKAKGQLLSISQGISGIESLTTNELFGSAQITQNEGLLIPQSGGRAETDSNYWDNASGQTISVWFKANVLSDTGTQSTASGNRLALDDTWGTAGRLIMSTRDYDATGRPNGFEILIASNQIFVKGPQLSSANLIYNHDFLLNEWYNVTIKWDDLSGSFYLYLNGERVNSAITSGSGQEGQTNLRFGQNIIGGQQFEGNILGARIENIVKTDGEILSDYNEDVSLLPL